VNEVIVDNFAGGGGASSGIEAALGRAVDYAINHDPEAIAMHRVNHPTTVHFCSSVWDVNPTRLAAGRPVGLGWFSPDCTFHSKARGGKPFRDRNMARRRRGLANLIPRWAATPAAPRVICLENVEEFADWGPLLGDGKICPKRRGMYFRRWHRQLEQFGYRIDMREMKACDYGAPTTRKRLFIVMRRDAGEIIFPEATHGHWQGAQPYRTAAECIDWSIPCPSIFERSRPLAEATLRRIARGVMRYVVDSPNPFIVGIDNKSNGARDAWSGNDPLRTITTENRFALVAPAIANTRNGERTGQAPRVRSIRDPLPTVTAQGSQGALVAAFLAKHYGGVTGHEMQRPIGAVTTVDHHSLVTSHLLHLRRNCDGRAVDEPLRTISAQGNHFGEVRAFLVAYYGNDKDGQKLGEPLRTVTTKDRLGLVMVHGEPYEIVDIGMRMLAPHELYRAQGFRPDYIIDHGIDQSGAVLPLTKTAQVRMCGNSVSPSCAEALVRANYVEQRQQVAA
jgi:DNA (cytosine-5)-methyltransferase 1